MVICQKTSFEKIVAYNVIHGHDSVNEKEENKKTKKLKREQKRFKWTYTF